MTRLTSENLSYAIDQAQLLRNISFSAESGQLIGLIGPNGAGKSTLLKMLAGVLPASSGQVRLADTPLNQWPGPARAKKLAFLAQQEQPAWSVSAETLVALGRLPYTGSTQVALEKDAGIIRMALQAAGVDHLSQRAVDTLSGGELRRVQCARLFATVADVWLADEPIAALDPLHQLQIMQLLKTKAETGLVIAALHDLSIAARYCDRLLLLNDGELVADGAPQAVLTEQNLAQVYRIRADITTTAKGLHIAAAEPLV
ncbi:ABC transporter ATP-binding protein [Simiduia agarivorans]|uniref:Iron(III) dicitrate transport ATP-binding protein FecE n=1 Tax=Simiduia agarivorans (strain DSM 21679 / JCM 13881 / BCRC 17597 / SA1) TaxID=1117647 RepID=K4L1H6_SIMAS|nr:ABC transporter ATP-binding protein [Simiduia agarivorans]AFV00028.1 iron(III) dicitrate transport ATP-binding protein FecE [Simiduia agarivorans SA1 = DSM 21679]